MKVSFIISSVGRYMTVKAFLLPVQGNPRLSSAILLWVANQIPLPSDSGVTRKASIGSEVEV